MSDLISRQAVDKIIDGLLENDNLQASPSVWHGLHMIKQLPSAQPEIIRCKDCKYHLQTERNGFVYWSQCNHPHWDLSQGCQLAEVDNTDFCSWAERKEE